MQIQLRIARWRWYPQLFQSFICLFILIWATGCQSELKVAESQRSQRGMVVSADPLASEAGIEMLKRGGNAVDAAVATTFAISVVEPFSAGIGGGGFLLAGFPPATPQAGEDYTIAALDFRERAPKAATQDMYLDEAGEVKPRSSLDGHLAAGTPGTVAGLYTVHQYYGKLPWATVVQPAIALAENGFPVSDYFLRSVERRQEVILSNPAAKAIFTRNGEFYQPGEVLIQKDLATTLKKIAEDPNSFYRGEIAEAIAADMAKNGGLITLNDLKAYTPIWRKPICGEFRETQVCSMPPPSSGGVHLVQILNMIGDTNLKRWGRQDPNTLHLLAEAMRIAYADRATYLGDPDFVTVPIEGLTSLPYAAEQRQAIDMNEARPSTEVKPVDEATLKRYFWESPETSHLTVVDNERNVVSLTFTINGSFGAAVVAEGTGILLNNEMDDFAAAPGVPNLFGLVGGEANAIAPLKTPLSSMSPTIVTRDGKFVMAGGSPGGSTIITTSLQLVLNVVEFGMNAGEAVSEPRIHHQWLPDRLIVEKGRMNPETLDELRRRGHDIEKWDGWGNANLIRLTGNGVLEGAADPRREGAAIGLEN
ncbi:gamma-glutamyltransferase [Lyngbya aestuarii BL J]|uniref:Glutathione hydrolase proenzyme n=1 Tax=Lyngbya aestuarii BL J TaxID=1348334 RepID=U7QM81_9CYAN|nr:gamma-glutamyltransferase [Lyngbya aestuarii]ERT09084.1 gamma-glutamyltransferase [Lyngbya aestuarii BL J]